MTIHRHIERFRRAILVEIEKDTHGCGLRISRHIENIPACGLIGQRWFAQVYRFGRRIRLIDVQGIVAEIPVGERSVKSHVVPYPRVLLLRWCLALVGIVVNILEPD